MDEIEKPSTCVLYRQTSTETRLSPIHLSDDSDDDLNVRKPNIVGVIPKKNQEDNPTPLTDTITPPPSRKSSSENEHIAGNNKLNFMKELENKFQNMHMKNNASEHETKLKGTVNKEANELRNNNMLLNCDGKKTIITSSKNEKERLEEDSGIPIATYKAEDQHTAMKYRLPEASLAVENVEAATDGETPTFRIVRGKRKESECVKTKSGKMATIRPKSPKQGTPKNDKEESFWDKIGTLGRKKRIKEVQEVEAVEAEGKYAIDSPGNPVTPDDAPEDYELGENEERTMVDPKAFEDPKLKELEEVLVEWINDELASQRIIVQDLAEDLYDGQILQKLLEKLTGDKLDVPEVTQSEEGQKQKLAVVLHHFNKVLGIQKLGHNKWNVEAIHSKNIVPIMHLLVALARHFRPPVRLPEHVSVKVVVVQKSGGQLAHKTVREKITTAYDDVGMRCERDAFDTLFDHAPDKLKVVKKSLVTFVNKHLNKINLEVTELENQFHDGVYLIMLMGLLEGFFVPLYSFYPTAKDFDQKVHNVAFAFELMEEVGLQRPKARPEDVVNMDLKSTLRVLYNLFLKYRSIM